MGLLKHFTASTKVTPCLTYHIKIAIADAKDGMLDSGVFLEKGSFRSENPPSYKVEYQFPKFNYGIEGCNNARVVFYRNPMVNDSINLSYTFKIGGTATEGKDYDTINNQIYLPSGKDSTWVDFTFLKDTIAENNETIILSLQSTCPDFPDIQTVSLSINDKFPYQIPEDKVCSQGSVMLNRAADKSTNIQWVYSNQLSCLNCLSPTAKPDSTQYFKYQITDIVSNCSSYDSVKIDVVKLNADFSFGFQSCYSSLDLFFFNKSYNAKRYFWDFGDNTNSEDQDPAHHYPHTNTKEAISYNVTLTAKSNHPQCSAEVTKTITISKPLFIPNLMTPNGDRKNDIFEIQGISDECWKLTIFNRWGSIVYQKENYQNNFEGTNLEEGTYYYQLENGNKDREYKGWLQLIANSSND
jgi:gliding motility-associated-like protein